MLKQKRGQAIFEILPATIVFGTVVFASMIYYRIMREQQIRHEVVRNIMFKKINNSGPLTTVPEDWDAGLDVGTPNGAELPVLSKQQNANVDPGNGCFRVMAEPGTETESAKSPWLKIPGDSSSGISVPISVWAVVYRKPSGNCVP